MKERINKILHALNENLFEREEIVQLALLTTISGESIFLLGLPGVAKSLIARRIKEIFKDGNSFEYLMNRFSTPDEIFGPIAISKLKKYDTYERITEKYLPTADIVFLDEIWKAGPSIQNSLLTVINEKVYRNGQQEIEIPLKGLISASNELPAKGEGLEALWDRFIIRYLVKNISDPNKFNAFLSTEIKEFVSDAIKNHGYSLKYNLSMFTNEINDLKLDIDNQTKESKRTTYYEPKSIKIGNAIYYEIVDNGNLQDRNYRRQINYLRKSAFDTLNKSTYKQITLYYKNGEESYNNRFEAFSKEPNTITIREYDSWNRNNTGTKYDLISNRKNKTEITTKIPHKAIISEWNKQVNSVINEINKTIKEIETFKKKDLASLKENIFVNKKLALLAEHNLNQTINSFASEKLKVEKLKKEYDAL